MKKGSGEPQEWSNIAPPAVPPPEALYDQELWRIFSSLVFGGIPGFIPAPPIQGISQQKAWGVDALLEAPKWLESDSKVTPGRRP